MSGACNDGPTGPDPDGSPLVQSLLVAAGVAQAILLLGLVGAAVVHRIPGMTATDVWKVIGATLIVEVLWDVAAMRWVRRAMAANGTAPTPQPGSADPVPGGGPARPSTPRRG